MNPTNKYGLPQSVYNAIADDPYDAGDSDITTTSLINPPQLVALAKRYKDTLPRDISEDVWAFLGKCVHSGLERATPDGMIAEKRYFANVLGWKVSGQVDLLDSSTLVDYKLTSVWTYIYGSRLEEWTAQGNVNHWLYHQNTGKYVTNLQNILFLRDWVSSKSGGDYPPVQVVTVNLPLWPLQKAERYVHERVNIHQIAQATEKDNQLPSCTDEERWFNGKTKKFARCETYCPVRSVCTQIHARIPF